MRDRLELDLGQGHRLQPAQHAQFGFRIAKSVEHHHPDQRFHVDRMPRAAKHPLQFGKTERFPEFGQRPYIAKRPGRLEAHRRCRWRSRHGFTARHLEQTVDHRIKTTVELIKTAKRRHGTFLHPSAVVPVGLDELDVAATSGGGDLDMHAATLSPL